MIFTKIKTNTREELSQVLVFLFLRCKKCDQGVGKAQYVGHKTAKQPHHNGHEHHR